MGISKTIRRNTDSMHIDTQLRYSPLGFLPEGGNTKALTLISIEHGRISHPIIANFKLYRC